VLLSRSAALTDTVEQLTAANNALTEKYNEDVGRVRFGVD
jgi:hypothetical protein